MRAVRFPLVVLACCSWFGIFAQDQNHTVNGFRFYEKLAQRDADYEQSLLLLSNQDESDYWADQRVYERNLGKMNFTSYLVYMKGKKDAYKEHLKSCTHDKPHSELYFQKAKEYLSLSDTDFFSIQNTGKVTQSDIKK
ncbi:MAG: hypothetical protein AAF348_03515 [Bacteroidota bacterium]